MFFDIFPGRVGVAVAAFFFFCPRQKINRTLSEDYCCHVPLPLFPVPRAAD